MNRLLARPLTAEEAVERLVSAHLEAADLWEDARILPPHRATATIACCETAFARVAIVGHVLRRVHQASGARLVAVFDRQVEHLFDSDGDEESRAHYGVPLRDAAREAIIHYGVRAAFPIQLTGALLERLGANVGATIETSDLFLQFGNRVAADLRRMRIRRGPGD